MGIFSGGSGSSPSSQPGMLLPVRVATTANSALSGLLTVDGVTLVAGDRVLAWQQTTASQNGVYVVAAGAWSRANDALNYAAMAGKTVFSGYEGTEQYNILFGELDDGTGTPTFAPAAVMSFFTYTNAAQLHSTGESAPNAVSAQDGSGYFWWARSGYEVTVARAAPADGAISAGQVFNYYDKTDGAAKFVRKGKSDDGTVVQNTTVLSPNGTVTTRTHAAGADADFQAGDLQIWFDQTNGAAKLMVKAKQADGTVKTASVALS